LIGDCGFLVVVDRNDGRGTGLERDDLVRVQPEDRE
jgi:hypothetical protein